MQHGTRGNEVESDANHWMLQRVMGARKAHQQAEEEKERYEMMAKKMHAKVSGDNRQCVEIWLILVFNI